MEEEGERGGRGREGNRGKSHCGSSVLWSPLLVLINTHHFKLVCGNNNLNQINNSKCEMCVPPLAVVNSLRNLFKMNFISFVFSKLS